LQNSLTIASLRNKNKIFMFWYQYAKHQLAAELKTDFQRGLTAKDVSVRLAKFGPNQLPETPPESVLAIFLRQFKSPLIYILVVCSGVVFYLGEYTDSIIIGAVLIFNAVIGAIQEGRSQQTLLSLKKLSSVEASVVRGWRVVRG
jgi:Ca2+-transporting ATPase